MNYIYEPHEVVKLWREGHSIDELIRKIRGGFGTKECARQYVFKCVYDDTMAQQLQKVRV